MVVRIWPNTGLKGEMTQELRTVAHFEQAVEMLQREDIIKNVVCGPNPLRHVEGIQKMIDAGYDHVYIHQIGPDQEGFFRFYKNEVLPGLP